jgi:hypothetical protein
VWDKPAVGIDTFLDVGEVAAIDNPVKPLGAAHQNPGLAAGKCVGDQFPGGLGVGMAVEEFDVACGMSQQ